MAIEDCPLPEVGEALSPFIKTRDEVASIRRGLQGYLESQLSPDGVPLASINLSEPSSLHLESPPPGLTGVRRAYWKALQAHAAAQAKYDGLKAELHQLKHTKPNATSTLDGQVQSLDNKIYISLLRQKEKHRRLKVVDRALSEIISAGSESPNGNLDDVVRKKVGELPSPPSTQPSFSQSPEVEAKIMELKKTVVATKRRVEQQKSLSLAPGANGTLRSTPQAEVVGLQKALQELTSWMENQLTLIANAEADGESVGGAVTNGSPRNSRVSTKDIEALYEQYIDARQRLVQTANESDGERLNEKIAAVNPESSGQRSVDSNKTLSKSPAEIVLPYLPALVAIKQEEQGLVQQNAYLRRQLTTAEDETGRLIRRLADESHLVQPGATRGKDWTDAAADAGATTEAFVRERLRVGEASAGSAKEALEGIVNLPKTLDGLA